MPLVDRLRSIIYPLIFLGMIALLWFAAWSDAKAVETFDGPPGVHNWYRSTSFDNSGSDSESSPGSLSAH